MIKILSKLEEMEAKVSVEQNLATPHSTDWYYYQGCLDTIKTVKNMLRV